MPKWLKYSLITVLLIVGIGYYIYVNAVQYAQTAAADGIEFIVEEMCRQTKFPAEETLEIMLYVRKFTQKIRIGEIGVFDVINVGKSLGTGNIPFMFMIITFEKKYLFQSNLPEKERKIADRTVSRFLQAIVKRKIKIVKMNDIAKIITEKKTVIFNGKIRKKASLELKEKLTDKEISECLKIMKSESDEAKIPDQDFKIDLKFEIDQAIRRGLPESINPNLL